MLLRDFIADEYALALSPGFFRFYAHMGILCGLEEGHALRATHVCGSSAGALVGGFLAAGLQPSEMVDKVMAIKRSDMWDMGGIGGLLKGQLFHQLLVRHLPTPTIEHCRIPIGITAFDLLRLRTNIILQGDVATAIRASCTFPGLFQPVWIDSSPHIDGGVFDHCGIMGLPGVPESLLVVNVVFGAGRAYTSALPEQYKHAKLLTIEVTNVPMVSPTNMDTMGFVAYDLSRRACLYALEHSIVSHVSENKWYCCIDGNDAEKWQDNVIDEQGEESTVLHMDTKRTFETSTTCSVHETYSVTGGRFKMNENRQKRRKYILSNSENK